MTFSLAAIERCDSLLEPVSRVSPRVHLYFAVIVSAASRESYDRRATI